MRKTLLLTLMTCLTAFTVSARFLRPAAALDRAIQSMQSNVPASVRAVVQESPTPALTIQGQNEPAVYLFDGGDTYLVVSADDCAPAVLGYSYNSAPGAVIPPAMKYWLEKYAEQIDYARHNGATPFKVEAATTDYASIAPMTATRWNQDAPYNNDCPEIDGKRCVTGCVATALAQVMKYHNYPTQGIGTDSYTWNNQTLSFDYTKTFDWANMLDVYTSAATATENAAVAQLMYACGVGVHMDYTASESGASSIVVPALMVDHFNYDKGIRYMPRDYYGIDEWQEIVYNNLKECGPIQYSGQSSDGGHSFVCDGYDKDGYFHINWGWGGMSDGYFLLTALTPPNQGIGGSSSGYNYGQDIIAGVRPPVEGSTMYEQMYCGSNFAIDPETTTLGSSIMFGGGFYNYSTGDISGRMGVKVVASDGTTSYINGQTFTDMPTQNGYSVISVTLPQTLKSGTYTVTPCFQTSTGEWRDIPVMLSCVQSLTMTVQGNNVTFSTGKEAELTIESYTTDTPFYIGCDYKVTVTLENKSDVEYYGTVALALVNAKGQLEDLGADYPVDLMPGETQQIEYISVFGASSSLTADTYDICFINPSNGKQMSQMKQIELKAAPTTTTLSASKPVVENANSVDASNLHITSTITCKEGYFGGALSVVIFPYDPGTTSVRSVGVYSTNPMFLESGKTDDIDMTKNFEAAEVGKTYFAAIYNGQNPVSSDYTFFTVSKTTGVDDMAVKEAPIAVQFYTLQGIAVEPDLAAPGIYLRVRHYENGKVITDRYLKR